MAFHRPGTIISYAPAAALLIAWLPLAGGESAFDPTKVPAKQLVREVVNHEVGFSGADHSRWMYRQQHTDPHSNELKECIDTGEGTICRVLARNGHPLTPQEAQGEIQQIQELARNPAKLHEQQKARRQDGDRALKMQKMLPDAFDYEYDGREGRYVRLRFRPDPNFRPPDRESRVFHGMVGSLLVDPESRRLVAIHGRLVKDVDFGLGVLGRLKKGGSFEVRREPVGEGVWQTTLLDVDIHGRAILFRTINAQQHEVTDNFKKVPANLTVAQAASMLEAPSLQARSGHAP
jgi:hypothetical protein